MAMLTLQTVSKCLKMTTVVCVIVPDSVRMDVPMSKRKTLYLLHGLSDNGTMWARRSMIENFAEKYGLVVVMPSCDRSFYLDGVNGQDYYSYVSKELPQYMHKLFNISLAKENNFIAGLSMGGFGAMRIALLNSENYFAVGSFSGVLDLRPLIVSNGENLSTEFPQLKDKICDLENSNINPINLLKNAKNDLKMYVACGTEDNLLYCSQMFEKEAIKCGVQALFEYGRGGHEWNFWNSEIEKYLKFALED